MLLYHGSNVEIRHPEILTGGFYKDFGYGFYCTEKEKQAVKWALTKTPRHVVNKYEYIEMESDKILKFGSMTEEWLDFIAACRSGKPHHWDIVEGPMADDTVWNYVEDYLSHVISRAAFWELVKFKYPTHQIAFCSAEALSRLEYRGRDLYEEL